VDDTALARVAVADGEKKEVAAKAGVAAAAAVVIQVAQVEAKINSNC